MKIYLQNTCKILQNQRDLFQNMESYKQIYILINSL